MEFFEKQQGLRVSITTMQLIKLSEKMKYLTSKHAGPMWNKPVGDVELSARYPDTETLLAGSV